jgi:hypothetical protein
MKCGFSSNIFEKILNIKIHENLFSGNRDVPCRRKAGRTDRHDEDHSGFLEFANAHLSRFKIGWEMYCVNWACLAVYSDQRGML